MTGADSPFSAAPASSIHCLINSVHHCSGDKAGVECFPYTGHLASIALNAGPSSAVAPFISLGLIPGLKADLTESGVTLSLGKPARMPSSWYLPRRSAASLVDHYRPGTYCSCMGIRGVHSVSSLLSMINLQCQVLYLPKMSKRTRRTGPFEAEDIACDGERLLRALSDPMSFLCTLIALL